MNWSACELKDLAGGPGPWIRMKIQPRPDEKKKSTKKRRKPPAAGATFRIRKNNYYAIQVAPGADSSEKPYLIVKTASALKKAGYDIKTARGGVIPKGSQVNSVYKNNKYSLYFIQIVDVTWMERDFRDPLKFFIGKLCFN